MEKLDGELIRCTISFFEKQNCFSWKLQMKVIDSLRQGTLITSSF